MSICPACDTKTRSSHIDRSFQKLSFFIAEKTRYDDLTGTLPIMGSVYE